MPYKLQCVVLLITAMIPAWARSDWPQFRGMNASSVDVNAKLPTTFSGPTGSNIAWKVPLPGRGVSGPIVVGGQVISTSSGGVDQRRIFVTSIDQQSGKVRWQQEMVARGRPFCHPTSANAAPTPVSDGKNIFAFYSSNDLMCLDLSGNLIWYRALAVDNPKAGNDTGMSSSPIVVDGVVIVQIECQGDSFVSGIDALSGESLWRVDRPRKANWASPVAAESADGRQLVMVQCGERLDGLDPRTGKQLWTLPIKCSTIPTVTVQGNRVFVPSNGITSLQLGSFDKPPQNAWENNKLSISNSSPLVVGGSVFCVNRNVLTRGDIESGELKSQMRLTDAKSIWSSPVVAQKSIYLFADDGKCFVIDISNSEPKTSAVNELGDAVLGTPAISQNALFVRSSGFLWKIAEGS